MQKDDDMNTVTLDNATYKDMSDFASQNNVSIAEMLKNNWHDFKEYVKSKKGKRNMTKEEEFLKAFSGDWENGKSSVEVVAEYRRNNQLAPKKDISW